MTHVLHSFPGISNLMISVGFPVLRLLQRVRDFDLRNFTLAFIFWGSKLSKDAIAEHAWILQPLAAISPSQPVHNNSLFQVFERIAGSLPRQPCEGDWWLMVYDFKVLTQWLVRKFNRVFGIFFFARVCGQCMHVSTWNSQRRRGNHARQRDHIQELGWTRKKSLQAQVTLQPKSVSCPILFQIVWVEKYFQPWLPLQVYEKMVAEGVRREEGQRWRCVAALGSGSRPWIIQYHAARPYGWHWKSLGNWPLAAVLGTGYGDHHKENFTL